MSAFFSFANYLDTALDGSGLNIYIERKEDYAFPYLLLSELDERYPVDWIADLDVMGWLVVQDESDRPLIKTVTTLYEQIRRVSMDTGLQAKYEYTADTETQFGLMKVKLQSKGPNRSNDPNKASHPIRWNVWSNFR